MSKGQISIVEVGPRDGLQNEKAIVPVDVKKRFIELLVESRERRVEITSFVRPGVIPQLADAPELVAALGADQRRFSALVPNRRGMESALEAGLPEVAVFTAASETFTKRNINATIAQSLERFEGVFALARANNVRVRAYVSTVIECPYEGKIKPARVLEVSDALLQMGAYEISLGETIGVAVPDEIARLLELLLKRVPAERLAGHFHDTRGTALANVARALEFGLRTFDSSAGGLGGCPYAPGAAGNLATEDLVYFLQRSEWETGVNLDKLVDASAFIYRAIGRPIQSRVHASIIARRYLSEKKTVENTAIPPTSN